MDGDRETPLGFPGKPIIGGGSDGLWRPFFEGPVRVTFYDDAVHVRGRCQNCNGQIEGVTRIHKNLRLYAKTEVGRREFMQTALETLRNRHQCSLQWEGRDDVDLFFRRIFGELTQ